MTALRLPAAAVAVPSTAGRFRLLARSLRLIVYITLGVAASRALWLVARHRLALRELWGEGALVAVMVTLSLGGLALIAALFSTRATSGRGQEQPAAPVFPELRALFVILVAGAVVYLSYYQPFRRLVFDVALGVTASAFGLWIVVRPLLERSIPRRVRFWTGFLLFNTALVLVGGELLLRAAATLRPSPLFAREDGAVVDRIDAMRYPPGLMRFGFPTNEGGHYDETFRDAGVHPRVIMVGDSFSASIVPHHYHFSTVVERELGVVVDNLGVPGVGPLEYQYLLEYEGLPLDGDVVMVNLFVGNDFTDAMKVRRGSRGLRLWFDRGNVLLVQVPKRLKVLSDERARLGEGVVVGEVQGEVGGDERIDNIDELNRRYPWVLDWTLETPQFSRDGFINMERSRVANSCRPGSVDIRPLTSALKRMRAAAGDVPLVVAIIPDVFQLEDAVWTETIAGLLRPDELERDLPQRLLCAWLDEQQIPYVDLLPALRAVEPEADGERHCYYVHDSHFNVRGNEVAGRAMAELLRGLLPK